METYIIPAEPVSPTKGSRFLSVLVAAGFSAALILANLLIFPRSYLNGSFAGAVVMALIVGVLLAMVRRWSTGKVGKPLRASELRVSDGEIRRVFYLRFNSVSRSVRKGRIRTMAERDMAFDGKGTFLSEHGPRSAFAFNGVLIPESLPNYRELCALAESWKAQ